MIELAVAGIAAVASVTSALIAAKAVKNTKPVANGFANHVTHELRYIRARLDNHIDTCG